MRTCRYMRPNRGLPRSAESPSRLFAMCAGPVRGQTDLAPSARPLVQMQTWSRTDSLRRRRLLLWQRTWFEKLVLGEELCIHPLYWEQLMRPGECIPRASLGFLSAQILWIYGR